MKRANNHGTSKATNRNIIRDRRKSGAEKSSGRKTIKTVTGEVLSLSDVREIGVSIDEVGHVTRSQDEAEGGIVPDLGKEVAVSIGLAEAGMTSDHLAECRPRSRKSFILTSSWRNQRMIYGLKLHADKEKPKGLTNALPAIY